MFEFMLYSLIVLVVLVLVSIYAMDYYHTKKSDPSEETESMLRALFSHSSKS